MELAHREYVHAVAEETIDHCVALQHVAEDIVIERVALIEQPHVDLWKRALKVAKRSLDRREIKYRQISLHARRFTSPGRA